MAQLSLYLRDETMRSLRADAKKAKTSVSKYVAGLVEQQGSQNGWPKGYWDSIYGALDDPSFVIPSELDSSLDGSIPSFDIE